MGAREACVSPMRADLLAKNVGEKCTRMNKRLRKIVCAAFACNIADDCARIPNTDSNRALTNRPVCRILFGGYKRKSTRFRGNQLNLVCSPLV